MKHSLQLKLSQSLTMTPQLQQAIRLLQLSTLELNTEIQDALDSNMMLELEEEAQNQGQANGNESEIRGESLSGDDESYFGSADAVATDIPEELAVDSNWEDIYDGSTVYSGTQEPYEHSNPDLYRSYSQSLAGHLLWQLNLTPTTETDRAIAVAVIDALDDDGYLESTPEDLCEVLNRGLEETVELDEVKAMLRLVQSMEPAGVAARDLQECLYLQLCQLPAETSWLKQAKVLVDKHFALLAAHDYNQLMRRIQLDRDQLTEVIALVQSLNPRPANGIQDLDIQYIIPDVYVRKVKNTWRIDLNTESLPQLRINNTYAGMIKRADNSDENTSMKSHLQEARWFIKSLQSRSETLLRVATVIVEKQRAFLDYGEEAMKPMVLHDIAEELGMHESTISRVTTKKYMHTPRGIFELKYFFSSHVGTDHGGVCSSTAIRALIKKLIDAEKPQKPLSDSKIADLLADQGIRVARRTVAKYREGMLIAPSNERKRLS